MTVDSAAAAPETTPATEDTSSSSERPARPAHMTADGLEALMHELRPDLYRYALWVTRNAHFAEDAVQEALIRAWRARNALKDAQALKPWLLTIVRRECARFYSRKQLDTRDVDALNDAEQALIATSDDAELAELRAAMFRLERAYREPLVLQVLLGFSADEIAATLGIRRGAVLTRLFRARKKLGEILNVDELEAAGRE
jgi:RNA polymerase sigma-70 factor (ECF subfamily)